MMNSFQDTVVVVTGAGSGIGRATSLTFARLRARVVLADVNEERLERVRGEIDQEGGVAQIFKIDVSDRDQVASFAQAVLAEFGRVDVVVNNAGILLLGEMRLFSLDEFHRTMGVNFWGVIHMIQGFLPAMIERRRGHFVNVSSVNGLAPLPFVGPYSVSKSAVLAISETLRLEVARFGVGVTTICPGLTKTRIREDAVLRADSETTRRFLNSCMDRMKRGGVDAFAVARRIPPAIIKNRAVVLISAETRLLYGLYRLWPKLFRLAAAAVLKRKI
jgi:NAD(P)-dependent dehydrogenase (short-subunit alcohol dehydrogenase family)